MRNDNNCVLLLFLGTISKQLNKRSKGLNKSSATGAEGGSIKLTMKRVEPVIDMDINIYIWKIQYHLVGSMEGGNGPSI